MPVVFVTEVACCVTDEELILASEKVPEVIFDVAKLGMSDAPKDNLADGTVPEVKLSADSDVKSTCCVTDPLDNLAFANVPDVMADAENEYLFASYVLILFLHQ